MAGRHPFDELTDAETEAIRGAAVWYAKHHAAGIAGAAAATSALEVAERQEYMDLLAGLAKLGVRLRLPDGVQPPGSA